MIRSERSLNEATRLLIEVIRTDWAKSFHEKAG